MSFLIDLDHAEWIHAFNRWYHSGNRENIINNLRKGVPLSPQNSRFLAAVLDGQAKPLTGKQTGLALFTSNVIDNKIRALQSRGFTREAILADLKRTGLMKGHIAITGLDKRTYRPKKNSVEQRAILDKQFCALYEKVTAI